MAQLCLCDGNFVAKINILNIVQQLDTFCHRALKCFAPRYEAGAASAFVDGELIQGIKEHLFSVLRDIIYVHNEIQHNEKFDLTTIKKFKNIARLKGLKVVV